MTAPPDLDGARDAFVAAQLAGDRRKALTMISTLAQEQGVDHASIRRRVIRAAQEEIGRLWQENAISIAQEHMATAISHLALAELFSHERPAPRNHHVVVVACVQGEMHDFPARLVADELDVAGFDVRFLGANVPTDNLLTFITQERPDLLVISATMAFHADAVRDTVRRVRAAHAALPIAVGGQVCAWVSSLSDELGVEITGNDAVAFVEQARQLLAGRKA